MSKKDQLEVKILEQDQIQSIAHYWSTSTEEHLFKMGVDLGKRPSFENVVKMLELQLKMPVEKKQSLATIWFVNGEAIGHCNVNKIQYGDNAAMHLHIWRNDLRKHGFGLSLLPNSIRLFFDQLKLNMIYCEPKATNKAPNALLKRSGFTFVKNYVAIPGAINYEQEVSRWELKKNDFLALNF